MKKKLAKILALSLMLVMVLGLVAACGEAAPSGTLTVAYGAPATGEFIAGWGNSSYDITIRNLLHGDIGTVIVSPASEIMINPTVVKEHSYSDDAQGNRTYTFTINEGLLWSDGTEITARDFVADALWVHNPAWIALGASTSAYDAIIGRLAYRGGVPQMTTKPDDWDDDEDGDFEPEQIGWRVEPSDYFQGIRLLGDYEFSLTIDGDELPYFFELIYAGAGAIPLHSWAPGVDVITDANGSKFSADITNQAQRVSETERFAPTIVAGPYTLVSFENDIVTLEVNPNFAGDAFGNKPKIEFIQQIMVADEVAVDSLFAGEVDLLPYEIRGGNINRVRAESGFSTHEHLRDGYGVMHIVHSWGPTADRNVRWALAHLVDRQAVLDQVLEGFGALIDTEAAESQWMWQMRRAEVIEAIRPIALSIDSAHDFLDDSEWKFESDGSTPFDRSKADASGSYLRHNSSGTPLVIRNGAANEEVGGIIEIETVRNAALAGMEFTSEFIEWATVLDGLYGAYHLAPEDQRYSTFSMGTGFGIPFDPYWSWHSDHLGTWMNPTFSDAEIDRLVMAMRETVPGDNAAYLIPWFDYVVRWNYLLPALPLYANMYVELFNDRVGGVDNVTPYANWAHPNVITKMTVR